VRRFPPRVRNERQGEKWRTPPPGVPVLARALPEVSLHVGGQAEPEPPEGRSSARRGVFAARAAEWPPESDAVSVTACNSLTLNAAGSPTLPSVAACPEPRRRVAPASLPVSLSSSDKPGRSIAGQRSGLKLLGKSVPVVVVEFAPPWGIVAEIAPSREWSRLAVAIRTFLDPEYAKCRAEIKSGDSVA